MVVAGVLGTLATARLGSTPQAVTAGYQVERFVDDLRHAQFLATSWGYDLRFEVSGGYYRLVRVQACDAGASLEACPRSTVACPSSVEVVLDRGRDGGFCVALRDELTVSGSAVTFDLLGRPGAASSFTFSRAGSSVARVDVAALTGFVSSTLF